MGTSYFNFLIVLIMSKFLLLLSYYYTLTNQSLYKSKGLLKSFKSIEADLYNYNIDMIESIWVLPLYGYSKFLNIDSDLA